MGGGILESRKMHSPEDYTTRRQQGLALKNRGDELTRLGGAENLAEAVRLCDEAIALLQDQPVASDGSDRDELASAWMKRGIALLNTRTPDALAEAVRCFDRAIELRQQLPLAENARFRYGLAAGWINRGDALTHLGGAENLDAATHSHTEAIALLETLPLEEDELYVKRLAIARLNLGIALEEKKNPTALAEAVQCYRRTIDLLTAHGTAAMDFILAGAWLNFGNASLHASGDAAAVETCDAAEKALALVSETESKELEPAEIGFKARHVLCRATLALLVAKGEGHGDGNGDGIQMDLVSRITDIVEDVMRLARGWEAEGVTRFRPLATQLFHVGTLIYERNQPQFLAEFVLDHLDPARATCVIPGDTGWHAIARESLSRVRGRIHGLDFAMLATPRGKQWIEILNEVKEAETRLQTFETR